MANVPGILYIGGVMTQGGDFPDASMGMGVSPYLNFATQHSGDQRANRVFPDSDVDGSPTAATLSWWPWFDFFAGDDVFVVAASPAPTSTRIYVNGTSPGWTTNQWAPGTGLGYQVSNNNLLGFGLHNARVTITGNGANYLDVASWPGGTPNAGEGFWISQGRFRDCHVIGAWRTATEVLAAAIPTRSGASCQALCRGIAPDVEIMRQLYERVPRYGAAPRFQFWKWPHGTATVGGWDDATGSARAGMLLGKARVDDAWTTLATGNTLQFEYAIIDQSEYDVDDWITNPLHYLSYQTALEQMIAWLRSSSCLNNASLKVLLVNHDRYLRNVDAPGGHVFANAVHHAIARDDDLVRCVNLDGRNLRMRGADASYPAWNPGEDNESYAVQVFTRDYPTAVVDAIVAWEAQDAQSTSAGSVPVYVYIGDSIQVGNITTTYASELDSAILTGDPRDARQMIWNRTNQAVETYQLGVNSNTSGTRSGGFEGNGSAEFSMLVELMNRHPDTGVVIIKRASNSSALATELAAYSDVGQSGGRWAKAVASEHYAELTADIANCSLYINNVLGKQVELMGVVVGLGTNDQAVADGGAAFATALPEFVDNLRADFGTHVEGKQLPVAWLKPQLAAATAIRAESLAVRAALEVFAAADGQFELIDCDDLDTISDATHLTADANISQGQRAAAAFDVVGLPNC